MKKLLLTLLFAATSSAFAQLNIGTPTDISVCDDNFDGVGIFNLTVNNAALLGGLNASLYTVNYFETQEMAQTNTDAIAVPSAYAVLNGSSQLLYARVTENTNPSNFAVASFSITANPSPGIVGTLSPVVQYSTNGTANLALLGEEMLLEYSDDLSMTFYLTQADAIAATNSLPDTYATDHVFLTVRIQSTTTGCFSIANIDVTVTSINMGDPINFQQCDDNGDGLSIFDLTQNTPFILGDNDPALYTVTYHQTLANAQQNIALQGTLDSYQSIFPIEQHVYVRMTRVADGEYAVKSFSIKTSPTPVPVQPGGLNAVDTDNDGQATFDLTAAIQEILSGAPVDGMGVSFYTNQTDALAGTNFIDQFWVYSSQSATLYFRYEKVQTGCFATGVLELVVVPGGEATPAPDGNTTQSFSEGDTLADIEVDGENILWYATDGQTPPPSAQDEATLPLTTVLVNGTTYYASQTIDGIESVQRLPVTVAVTAGLKQNNFAALNYYPNPVKDVFTLSNTAAISNVEVVNTLGQRVYSTVVNNTAATINFEGLKSGIYFVKVQSGAAAQTIKVIKE
jgi:hypothetical protein